MTRSASDLDASGPGERRRGDRRRVHRCRGRDATAGARLRARGARGGAASAHRRRSAPRSRRGSSGSAADGGHRASQRRGDHRRRARRRGLRGRVRRRRRPSRRASWSWASGRVANDEWLETSGPRRSTTAWSLTRTCSRRERVAAIGDVARFMWPQRRSGDELVRIEHWQVANDHAAHLAHYWTTGERADCADGALFLVRPVRQEDPDARPRRSASDDVTRGERQSIDEGKWLALYSRDGVVTGVVALSQPAGADVVQAAAGSSRRRSTTALARAPWARLELRPRSVRGWSSPRGCTIAAHWARTRAVARRRRVRGRRPRRVRQSRLDVVEGEVPGAHERHQTRAARRRLALGRHRDAQSREVGEALDAETRSRSCRRRRGSRRASTPVSTLGGLDEVGAAMGDALEDGAHQVGLRRAARECRRIRRARRSPTAACRVPSSAGTKETPSLEGTDVASVSVSRGVVDEAEVVAEPLDARARREDDALDAPGRPRRRGCERRSGKQPEANRFMVVGPVRAAHHVEHRAGAEGDLGALARRSTGRRATPAGRRPAP